MNKTKVSGTISIRETICLSMRGYRIWWNENPKLLISAVSHAIVNSLTPYAGIWLFARLINEIAGLQRPQTLLFLTAATISSTAILALLDSGLEHWKRAQWANLWHMQNKIFMTKLFSMDFAAVNDSHTQDLRFQIWQDTNSGAWGLYKLLFCFYDILKSIMTIGGAIALTVSLFTLPVPPNSGTLTILNHPFFLILILMLMFSTTYLAPFFSVKADSYWVKFSKEHKMGNRLFSFWLGTLGSEQSRALDIRIYRQDILSKSQLEQHNPFQAKSNLSRAACKAMGGYYALSQAVSQIFTGIAYVFVCLKALGGAYGIGSVTQYIHSITSLSAGVSLLISTLGTLRNNAFFLHTTFEFLDLPDNMPSGRLIIDKNKYNSFEIEFRSVSFKYPGQTDYALRNVSLTFQSGERFAIVGMNGSGKTTFIKLLCRLYDPTEGTILLNGIDIRQYNYQEYMSIFSVVFQDFKLLSFELGQNISAKTDYDITKTQLCLQNAGFRERFLSLPQGLKTIIHKDFDEQGIDFSGGESQKIALARALYKESAFIILDEPTAALDPIAESDIYNRMSEIVADKTAIFISHRLSSCRFCKHIAVFHEGQLIQQGSHEQLVSDTTGKYFELWNAQAQYYMNPSEFTKN